jgi:PIN domain nuclease of toxin-antitoxin system
VKLLLDTITFLWILSDEERIAPAARSALNDADNHVYLSAASVWEICVKHRLGKLKLPLAPERLVAEERRLRGIESLEISEAATLRLPQLTDIHRDPFDRILICQAIEHEMTIVTPDPLVRRYAIRTVW